MTLPLVIVLEDSPKRVQSLVKRFPNVEIIWTKTVSEFFDALRTADNSRLRLLILDHDLGLEGEQRAVSIDDGAYESGMHAVDGMSPAWQSVPIIVWSVNTPRAQEMVRRLREKGFIAVAIPHLSGHEERLYDAIATQVE